MRCLVVRLGALGLFSRAGEILGKGKRESGEADQGAKLGESSGQHQSDVCTLIRGGMEEKGNQSGPCRLTRQASCREHAASASAALWRSRSD